MPKPKQPSFILTLTSRPLARCWQVQSVQTCLINLWYTFHSTALRLHSLSLTAISHHVLSVLPFINCFYANKSYHTLLPLFSTFLELSCGKTDRQTDAAYH